MALILLRHTRPAIGEGICYGASDLDCAEDFQLAATRLLPRLPAVDQVVTSPLRRCRRLAELVATRRTLPLEADDRLAEMAFGSWEGRSWDEIDRDEVDAWAADFHHARPHGGESVAMLADRVGKALADLEDRPGTTLIVSHLGVIRVALARAGQADGWTARIKFGEWVQL